MSEARFPQPSRRTLLLTWLLLVLLTLATMLGAGLAGDPATVAPLALWQIGLVLILAAVKARQILRIYLNLRVSTPGWRGMFVTFVVIITALIWAAAWLVGQV